MNRQVLNIPRSKLLECSKLVISAVAFVLLLLLSSPNIAQPIKISSEPGPQAVAANIEYYEDASESLSIADVLSPGFSVNFLPYNRDILHFGITSSAYWIRFSLDWSKAEPDATKILEFGPPKLVEGLTRGGIELFVVDENGQSVSNYVLGTLRKVLNALANHKDKYITAYIPHPYLDEEGIMHSLVEKLGLPHPDKASYRELLKVISQEIIAQSKTSNQMV